MELKTYSASMDAAEKGKDFEDGCSGWAYSSTPPSVEWFNHECDQAIIGEILIVQESEDEITFTCYQSDSEEAENTGRPQIYRIHIMKTPLTDKSDWKEKEFQRDHEDIQTKGEDTEEPWVQNPKYGWIFAFEAQYGER